MAAWAPEAGKAYEVAVGTSFRRQGAQSKYHTLRYNFKPATVQQARKGKLTLDSSDVELVVPQTSGGGHVTFLGNSESHKETDCVLLCGKDGAWRIERLSRNIKNLKAERSASAGPHAAATSRATTAASASPPDAAEQPDGDGDGDDGDDDGDDVDESMLFGEEEEEEDGGGDAAAEQTRGAGSSSNASGPSPPAGGINLKELLPDVGGHDYSESPSDSD